MIWFLPASDRMPTVLRVHSGVRIASTVPPVPTQQLKRISGSRRDDVMLRPKAPPVPCWALPNRACSMQPSIGAYGIFTRSLQWITPSEISQTCVPCGHSLPSHSDNILGSAVRVKHLPSVGRIEWMETARVSPGSAPSTAIGPLMGLPKGTFVYPTMLPPYD